MKWKSACALMLAVLLGVSGALASGLDQVLSPWLDDHTDLQFSLSARLNTLLPYGESAIEMMNAVLSHLSMDASLQEHETALALCSDGDAVMDFTETAAEEGTELTTSLLPGRVLTSASSAMDAFIGAQEAEQRFELFSAIGELEACYQTLTDAIVPYAEEKKANYKIKDVASARWVRLAKLTAEQNDEIAPLVAQVLACGMDEAYRAQLEGLSFAKGFTVALYQTKEGGSDLALYMKGTVTLADGKPRALAYQWAFTQKDGVRTDSLKYEVVKSKTKVDFTREVHALVQRSTEKKLLLDGECELIVKENGQTVRTTRTYDLTGKEKDGDRTVSGSYAEEVRTTVKEDTETVTFTVTPEITLTDADGSAVLSGEAGIQQKKGKTVLMDVTLLFDQEPARRLEEAEESGELYEVQEPSPEVSMPPSSLTQNVEIIISGGEEPAQEEPAGQEEPSDYLVGEPPIGLVSYDIPEEEITVDLDGASAGELDALTDEMAQRLAGRLLIALASLPEEDGALIRDNLSAEDYAAFLALVDGL